MSDKADGLYGTVRNGVRYAVIGTLDEALAKLGGWGDIRPVART